MQISIKKVGKKASKDYGSLELNSSNTVNDLKIAFEKAHGLSRYRQMFKLPASDGSLTSLTDEAKTLSDVGINKDTELQLKDLGPQIGYRTVFIIEYLGPMLFVLFYASRPAFIYGPNAAKQPFDPTAWLGILCWTAHFLKREFETIFVHRFSRPTMPLFNLFKNSIYYWSFGAVIGYPLCHPNYTPPASDLQIQIGLAIFTVSEFLNLCVHVQLRTMRPAEGSKVRPMPSGPLFALVSCPNYLFEVLSWVGFSIMTQIFFNYVFTVVGFAQMAEWAVKKHKGYLRTYGDDYKKLRRKAIVPFAL